MKNKRIYGAYGKFDVVYVDLGKKPHGVEGGLRPAVIVSCDKSNHKFAPQVTVVPLSSKIKQNPVHIVISPEDVSGYGINQNSDFIPENVQTIAKEQIRGKCGIILRESGKREAIEKALIKQFDLVSSI